MQKKSGIIGLAILTTILVFAIGIISWNLLQPFNIPIKPVEYTYNVIKTYPHDPNAFTEGLVIDNNTFYESTGLYGESSLRHVNIQSGNVLKKINLNDNFFGEGIAIVNNSIIQLTWMENVGYVYNKETFALEKSFKYSGEGWGLTYDGQKLVMSNGSSILTFLDPSTFQKIGQIEVFDTNTPINNLNELEYVNGDIYANIWMQNTIVIINPNTGQIKGHIDLTGIYQPTDLEDVLNGIAYNKQTDELFITGKNWSTIFQIIIEEKNNT